MAGGTVYALRYAHAFASVAAAKHLDAAAAEAQLKDFTATLESSRELREVLGDPSIPAEQKLGVLDGLAERLGMVREARNFLAVIIDHGRLDELREILAEVHRLTDQSAGFSEAEVTSAHDLHEDDRRALEEQVARLAGTQVRVAYHRDESLLGGAVIRIGSTVYDGSLRAQLDGIRQTLIDA